MKIINEARLPYEVIGQIIDKYINENIEDTLYYYKIEYFNFRYNKKIYKMQVRYLKKYVEFRVVEYENEI